MFLAMMLILSTVSCSANTPLDNKKKNDTPINVEYKNEFYENTDDAITFPDWLTFTAFARSNFRPSGFNQDPHINWFGPIHCFNILDVTRVVYYPGEGSHRYSVYLGNNGYEFLRIERSCDLPDNLSYEGSQMFCLKFDDIVNAKDNCESYGFRSNYGGTFNIRYNRDPESGYFYSATIEDDYWLADEEFCIYLNTNTLVENFDMASDAQKKFLRGFFPQYGASYDTLKKICMKFDYSSYFY